MESTIILPAGNYYVGDLGFVLPENELRALFAEILNHGTIRNGSGVREITSSVRQVDDNLVFDYFWVTKTPNKSGMYYDQYGGTWGFDWGVFGCLPSKWMSTTGCYDNQKVTFEEKFKCIATPEKISIGHFDFTLNPVDQ